MRAATDAPANAPLTPFAQIGGRAAVRAIADSFYDLIERDPAYAALRALHAADLTATRASLTDFLTAWLGGSRSWFAARPRTCIMAMHRAIPTTAETAGEWLAAMERALRRNAVDPVLQGTILHALARMAHQMIA
jgi:hemoglobin